MLRHRLNKEVDEMRRLSLAVVLALSAASAALAQVSTGGNAQVNPNSSVVQPGLAKPPAGSVPTPAPQQQVGVPPNMANNPTTAQIAARPSAAVGSPVPIAGAGGTTSAPSGTDQQEFIITRLLRNFFNSL